MTGQRESRENMESSRRRRFAEEAIQAECQSRQCASTLIPEKKQRRERKDKELTQLYCPTPTPPATLNPKL